MDNHVEIVSGDWTHTEALHRPGMPRMLWRMLSSFGYTEPPSYVGRMYHDVPGNSCTVHVCIPAKLTYPPIDAWMVTAEGINFPETWDVAALKALTTFCENNRGVQGTAFDLLPVRNMNYNPNWGLRMSLIQDTSSSFYNPYVAVPYYYAAEMFDLFERRERDVNALLEGLRFGIEHREERITEREQRISEKDARIAELEQQSAQKDARIATLELQNADKDEQIGDLHDVIHDLNIELEDALADANPPPVQPIAPDVLDMVQGNSGLDSEDVPAPMEEDDVDSGAANNAPTP